MKGISGWNYHPYRPLNRKGEATKPFICRLAPAMDYLDVEWFDRADDGTHTLKIRPKESLEAWRCVAAEGATVRVSGLQPYTDYELRVERDADPTQSSAVRFARTGHAPGVVVNYLHPQDPCYLFSGKSICSPSIVKLPSGGLLTSMDVFSDNYPQNLTLLCRSDDGGATWRYVNDLFPCFWGTLFMHKNRLYMLSSSTENGEVLIGASDDEGETWTKPTILFVGSGSPRFSGPQHGPMPVVRHKGRLLFAFEYGCWQENDYFSVNTVSVDENADLLKSENWTFSEGLYYDKN